MIGFIKGKIISDEIDTFIIDVNGVGFLINKGKKVFLEGSLVELYVHTIVRENDISLWGFEQKQEKDLFLMLLKISGIGGKGAQSLVIEKGVDAVVTAVRFGDVSMLKAPGIGQKTAEKILIELKSKIDSFGTIESVGREKVVQDVNSTLRNEALEAMIQLGYDNNSVVAELAKLDVSGYSNVQSLIKDLLKVV